MEKVEVNDVSEDEINSFDLITFFVREVFGTYYIEEGNWTFDDQYAVIGRTYFADRKRYKNAVNDKTVENILQIYRMALTGHSTYKADRISQTIAQMYKKSLRFNIDYLMFFDDDTPYLRNRKIQMICHLTVMILERINGKTSISCRDFRTSSCILSSKLLAFLTGCSRGTYTEIVLQSVIDTEPGYEYIRKRFLK